MVAVLNTNWFLCVTNENSNNRLFGYQGIRIIEILLYLKTFSSKMTFNTQDTFCIERCNYQNHILSDLCETRKGKYLWNISYKKRRPKLWTLLNAGVFVPKRTRDRVCMKITRPRNAVAPFIENFSSYVEFKRCGWTSYYFYR